MPTRRPGWSCWRSSCSRAGNDANRRAACACPNRMHHDAYSAVILAGGDGLRLRSLTLEMIAGDLGSPARVAVSRQRASRSLATA